MNCTKAHRETKLFLYNDFPVYRQKNVQILPPHINIMFNLACMRTLKQCTRVSLAFFQYIFIYILKNFMCIWWNEGWVAIAWFWQHADKCTGSFFFFFTEGRLIQHSIHIPDKLLLCSEHVIALSTQTTRGKEEKGKLLSKNNSMLIGMLRNPDSSWNTEASGSL